MSNNPESQPIENIQTKETSHKEKKEEDNDLPYLLNKAKLKETFLLATTIAFVLCLSNACISLMAYLKETIVIELMGIYCHPLNMAACVLCAAIWSYFNFAVTSGLKKPIIISK